MIPKERLIQEIEVPEGVTVDFKDRIVTVNGPKGSVSKKIMTKAIIIEIKDGKVVISPNVKTSRSEKCLINTNRAHIVNMIKGTQEPYTYKLKVCSSHFPMSVKINGQELVVNNFIGEKVNRVLKLKEGVDVKLDGDVISVTSCNKELAGQVAGDIEKLTKRSGFDKRIFMDGIYIIEKAGVELQ
ncbi:50S ribosomal protein L6 [Candidatus Woesearchaeota archaeon]|nr:50S ribosomal protein L6 [Candidatus Woesearchaeota archaeon]